jgi:hypothetical protein
LLNTTIEGASYVILNIIGGKDLSLDEVDMAADLVKGVIDYSANVIFGACIDESMSDEVEIVIIATGFGNQNGSVNVMQENAMRQASVLSQKIDVAYNDKVNTAPQLPFGYAAPQAVEPIQAFAPAQPFAPATVQSVQPIEPAIPAQPVQPAAFEPDDPIPEPAKEEVKDRKHRPKFVDFFMKRNSEDK